MTQKVNQEGQYELRILAYYFKFLKLFTPTNNLVVSWVQQRAEFSLAEWRIVDQMWPNTR